MAQSDLILLFLTGLSVLIGISRGFTMEVLRLVIYILSGTLGYVLLPVFKPVVSFVPNEAMQKMVAVLLGTFVSWIVLKMIMHSVVGQVKKSCLKKVDRSLGGIFGGMRASFFLMLVSVFLGIVSPGTVRNSKIMTLSYAGAGLFVGPLPDLSADRQKKTDGEEDKEQALKTENKPDENMKETALLDSGWKENLSNYLQKATVHTKDGDKKLIEAISSVLVKSFSKEMTGNGGLDIHINGETVQVLSDEEKAQIMEKTFETQLIYWLNGKNPNGKEVQDFSEKLTKKKLAEQ